MLPEECSLKRVGVVEKGISPDDNKTEINCVPGGEEVQESIADICRTCGLGCRLEMGRALVERAGNLINVDVLVIEACMAVPADEQANS